MLDNYATGVLLDPFVDEEPIEQPAVTEPEVKTAPVEPEVKADPAPAQPVVETEVKTEPEQPKVKSELDIAKEEAAEQRRLAEFWANKAAGAPAATPAPKVEEPAPAPKKQLTKEEIADRLTEGDSEVLAEMGYVRREDVERIAEEIANKQIKSAETRYESGAELTKQYGDYLNPESPKFAAVAKEIQDNPTWQAIAKIDTNAALRGAIEVVRARDSVQAPAAPAKIDYDKRIENQSSPKTKPAANTSVSTVATPSQRAAAEAIGIPIKEFMDSVRETRGL